MMTQQEASMVLVSSEGGVAVAKLLAPSISQRESPIIQAEVTKAAERSGWKLVLDFTDVTMLGSMGLGMLITMTKQCQTGGGKMAMFGMSKPLNDLVRLTKLDRLLQIAPDKAGAIAKVK